MLLAKNVGDYVQLGTTIDDAIGEVILTPGCFKYYMPSNINSVYGPKMATTSTYKSSTFRHMTRQQGFLG